MPTNRLPYRSLGLDYQSSGKPRASDQQGLSQGYRQFSIFFLSVFLSAETEYYFGLHFLVIIIIFFSLSLSFSPIFLSLCPSSYISIYVCFFLPHSRWLIIADEKC